MAYIGRQLARGENKLFDDISSSFNGSTTVFNLTVSSVATSTATPFQLFVSLGGVMQKPNTDFTTAGNQITFTTAPAAGLSCWIMMQGDTIDQAAIPDSSVTPSKISGSNFAFSGDLRLNDADSSNYVGFKAPTTVSSNIVWTLPAADTGVSGYVLSSNGSGVLSWVESGDNSSPSFTGDVTLTDDGALVGTSSFNATYTGSVKTYTVTVASKSAAHRYNGSGSGSGYKINGKESPFLTLTPGRTYKFDQADGSNSGHPLRFYLEANKTTAYTTGVTTNGTAGNAGAYTQIVVSDTTPQVLHYQCSAHALMGNAVQTNSNVAAAGSLNGSTLASSVTASSLTSVGTLGSLAVTNNVTVGGNFTVSGTTTTINTQTLDVEDKNIVIGKVSTPSDTTADGGGITLKGASDKTFNWVDSTDAWTSSEHIHLGDNKKLLVGTGSDLSIFHNGTNSLIKNITGDLVSESDSIKLRSATGGEAFITATLNGAVDLYHNDAKKLETTSGGINVTGAINVNGAALATSPTLDLVADGAIAANHTVLVTSAGKAKEVAQVITTANPPTQLTVSQTATSVTSSRIGYDPARSMTFIIWRDTANDCNVRAYSWDDAALVLNNPHTTTEIASSGVESVVSFASHPTNGYHFACWKSGVGNVTRGRMFNFASNGQPSTGSDQDISASYTQASYANGRNIIYSPDDDKFVFLYWDSGHCYCKVLTPDYANKTVSPGSAVSVLTNASDVDIFYDEYSNKVIAGGWKNNYWYVKIGTISGTSISWTTNHVVAGDGNAQNNGSWITIGGEPDTGKLLFAWMNLDPSGNYLGKCKVGSVSGGNSFTLGSETTYETATGGTSRNRLFYDPTIGKLVIIYNQYGTSVRIKTFTISGTTPTFTTALSFSASQMNNPWMVYHPTLKRWAYVYSLSTNQNANTLFTGGATTNLTTENFIGFSSAAYSDGNTATINVVGNTTTQSSLTPGEKYYITNTGDLSTTAATPSVVAGVAVTSTKLLINPA